MPFKTTCNYGLTVTEEEKLNYYQAMALLDEDVQRIVDLRDPAKFDVRFVEMTENCGTYEEAYLAVEEEFKQVFKTTKYSNYESYRKARSRRINMKDLDSRRN
jgi:hypothetical protein